jgi:hypothetical protein
MSSSYQGGGNEPYNEGAPGSSSVPAGEYHAPSGGQPYETSQFPAGGQPSYQGGQQGYDQGYQQYAPQQGYSGQGQGQGQGQGHQHGGGIQGMLHGSPLGSSGKGRNVRSTFKTTEFWIYVIVVIALLIAAAVTDQGSDNQGFSAHDAWKYVSWLTIGYMISRGLTKFGGHERDDHDHHHGDRDR